ncbi:uncharacterized protein MYCGRDRAFT_107840 [Zymoseptoria tritici IPO323]|uniref:Helicase ATP-binding domain-containing protein n=1 Tax=Zymoseptoria tritici (strain CBS 115943 / IPO323) TaxID=336722 RepID=F9X2L4_ZYMTI|nr:uncharacterized protein MYCGRDRAFT_107840 [Zymoseptoria tritici IPO323]EGP89711.1 hypothetical protein MYCGRDRAFT_107840 [Zymoseptoria tritici IPO323]
MSSLLRLPPSIRVGYVSKYLRLLGLAECRNHVEVQRREYATAKASASVAARKRHDALPRRRRILGRVIQPMDPAPATTGSAGTARDALELSAFNPSEEVLSNSIEQQSNDISSTDPGLNMTMEYVKKHMDLPKASDYPHLSSDMFDFYRVPMLLRNACLSKKEKIETSQEWKHHQHRARKDTAFELVLGVRIGSVISTKYTGFGRNKKSALAAAWLQLLSELHTSGRLPPLLQERASYSKEELEATSKTASEILQDLGKQAPYARQGLFVVSTMISTFRSACRKAGLSVQSEGESLVIAPGRIKYDIGVEIPELCSAKLTFTGYGKTGKEAKNLAWANMLKDMHTNGTLRQLFDPAKRAGRRVKVSAVQDPVAELGKTVNDDADLELGNIDTEREVSRNAVSVADDPVIEQETIDNDAEDLELVNLDPYTMKVERDAKLEIYTYAAALGLAPTFDAQFVEPRTRRARFARGSKHIIQASIALPELGISITSAARDLETAEIGAAIEFKKKAEELRSQPVTTDGETLPEFDILTVARARQFVDFCRQYNSHIDMEAEQVIVAGVDHISVRIAVDGEDLNTPSMMRTKKDAMAVAYLLASLHIAKANPERLAAFAAALKIPQKNRTLDANISTSAINMMRDSLIRARRAGLPDVREVLEAEDIESSDARSTTDRRPLSPRERQTASKQLLESRTQFKLDADLETLRTSRAALPMSKQQRQVIDIVSAQTYSIIIGATGSGKTTQVPQIILDNAIERGEGGFCDIVCTQPRRLAATSIAQRVAVERDEPLGNTVGYHVRFNTKLPRPGGSITYCTTGILLAQLKTDYNAVFDRVSHLVIDEVHERDLQIDFLLVILKKAIARRQAAGKAVPKVILMSATLDKKLFADYLTQHDSTGKIVCPTLSVPGRTFPVKERYLADVVRDIKGDHRAEFETLMQVDNGTSEAFLAAENMFASGSTTKGNAIDWKRGTTLAKPDAADPSGEKEESMVPVALLAATIAHVCKTSADDGAILAFLPGLSEILSTEELLLQGPIFGVDFNDAARYEIHLLHSQVAPEKHDLQSVCLSIKAQGFRQSVSQFLGEAIEPPPQEGVDAAIGTLKAVEAFTADEELTALGRVLSKLPVHPTLGKMIILGVIFKCLHPMLILGSMDSERSIFTCPPGARVATRAAQQVFNKHDSDQLAYLEAFTALKSSMETFGIGSAYDYARSNYLSMGTFRWIDSTAQQILQHLVEAKLVLDEDGPQYGGTSLNIHSDNVPLIKCLLLAGMYPNIGVKKPGKSQAHRTAIADGVLIHPGSVNRIKKSGRKEDRIYAFRTLARNVAGTQLFMRDSTLITPLMLLLFGGTLKLQGTKKLNMDGWLPIRLRTSQDAEYASKLVLEFRKGLDRVLNNAFKSLSGNGDRSLHDDEMRDQFTSNVAELLHEQRSMCRPDSA